MIRAAIYARYSTDLQRDASIEDQVRTCRARIERESWVPADVYSDHAISGSIRLRPGYQKLLEDARKGAFDVVIAEALDRLSRDQEDVAALFKHLTFAGVTLITLSEGEISELHVGLKGTMNALFLKDLAQKTRRGLEGRVRQGRSGGGLCYGYDVVAITPAQGAADMRGERRINEPEAAIVRRIFTEFAAGRSPRAIAFALNAERVPGPHGGTWGPSTINGNRQRGTGILNNELYIGVLVWNRLRYIKDPTTGKRQSRSNPDSALIRTDVPDLRIVDQALWEAVKTRQATVTRDTRPDKATERPFWERARPRYLLSGLVKCGCCGGSFVKISATHFGCATARNKGAAVCSNRRAIQRDVLEATVLDGLRYRLMDPDLFKVFAAEVHAEINRARIEGRAGRTAQQEELKRIERRIRRTLDILLDTDHEPGPLVAELNDLDRRKKELEALLRAPEDDRPLLHPNLAEIYRRKVADLKTALEEPALRAQAVDLVRTLVEEIRAVPEGDGHRIEVQGELAGILALCEAAKKKPGREDPAGLDQQIKMVAGVGFEPTTFRL